jgi:DNA polymerase
MGALEASNHLGLEDMEFLYGDPMAAIASLIRHYICAPKGRELIVADYSAIEARVLCWLAGQTDAVRLFQREVDARREWQDGKISEADYKVIKLACDPYIDMAAFVYSKAPGDVTFDERQLGKAIILGCGYQMGGGTFFATCEQWGMAVTEELAGRCVKAYREKYGKVKALWNLIEEAAIQAVHKPGAVITEGLLKFKMADGFLFVRLPSGRKIAYPRPRVVLKKKWGRALPCLEFYGKNDKSVHWYMKDTYGGKLTENICQAIARDVMGVGMLNAEDAGYITLTSIHDEAVAEVAEGEGAVLEYERLLCKMPDWAKGIPLASEGYRSKRYRK